MDIEGEDFYIVDDLDLADESELRRVVSQVEMLLGSPGKGLRVSVLSAEQWQTVLVRYLPPGVRKGAERYTHVIRDRRDPQHLLVSPSAVRGINEQQRTSYQELIYALLRCIPTQLEGPLRRGVDDIVAGLCAQRAGIDIFCRTSPEESAFVKQIIKLLVLEYGYSEKEWAVELRRNPNKVMQALRKTQFMIYWVNEINNNEKLNQIFDEATNKRIVLIKQLIDANTNIKDNFFVATKESLNKYLTWLEQNPKKQKKLVKEKV